PSSWSGSWAGGTWEAACLLMKSFSWRRFPRVITVYPFQYGPVFTVFLGLQRVVVLCGYQAVKEALVDQAEEFSGRGQLPAFSKDFNHHGIVFANGQRWQQLRRFSLTTLRNFGMGKRSIEERIQEEAQCLVEELRKAEGTPFDPTFLLNHTVSNVICSIVFGKRFEYSDEKFLRLNKLITERFCVASSTEAVVRTIMEKIPGVHHAGHRCSQQIIGFIKERIQMQQASLDPHLEKHNPDSEFCMENLVMATFNLFFAGTETISTTLRFGFLILMKHPQVQGQGGRSSPSTARGLLGGGMASGGGGLLFSVVHLASWELLVWEGGQSTALFGPWLPAL
uniref:Uncharacterized protein n=1 Tax=Laticauda laticaudata TaxID=8630 RepID=A0A8C5SQ32_LATLA